MIALRGSCLCGGVRFENDGPPMRSSHCHCRQCQKAHGAPFRTRRPLRAQQGQRMAITGALGELNAIKLVISTHERSQFRTEFAADSSLEGTRFEPSVPLAVKTLLGHAFRKPTLCGSNPGGTVAAVGIMSFICV
jgi:hypothetical protein